MSFNIRYGSADDGKNRWESRRTLALARIQAFKPDILGLQECQDDAQAEFIKDSLQDYSFLGVRREGGHTGLEMAPLLFKKSVFRLLQSGHFWLSETPHVIGSKSWDSTFARTASWAQLLHLQSNHSMVFINTHFDYQPTAIAGAAQLLHKWLVQTWQTLPIVITGDFNSNKDSQAYHLLTEGSNLFDAYRRIHNSSENEATFHDFGKPDEKQSIDWILVSDQWHVLDAAIDQTHTGTLFPSDHYPVLATLTWKDE